MQKLLILDIDETLIFATESNINGVQADAIIGPYLIYKRPHLDRFLDFCFSNFKVAVWTSSSESYCKPVVEFVFNGKSKLEFVWSRERCVRIFNPDFYDYDFVKDLKKVKRKGYDLENVIIVDDTPAKLRRNYGNHVYIRPFEGDQSDTELLLLEKYLPELRDIENVRKIEKRGWRNKCAE